MRLQLIAALVVLLPATGATAQVDDRESGEGKLDSEVALYADDDATTVITTLVAADLRLPAPVVVDAHALIDAVSSASVDVVSAATPRWTENRIELGAKAQARLARLDLVLGYVSSGENDWRSHGIALGVGKDLADDNTTIRAGYGYTTNRIGRARDPVFEKTLDVHGAELSLAQVIGPSTLASLAYTVQRSDGYHASPYRYVMTTGGGAGPEVHPSGRTRHAITGRLLRALGPTTTVDASYRAYVDGWGVSSHTAQLALTRELGDALDLRVRARGYYQDAADFYQESYAAPMRYMSADRELSTFWDAGGGLKLAWYGEAIEIGVKIDGSYYRFLDFGRLGGRVAVVTGGGITWRW